MLFKKIGLVSVKESFNPTVTLNSIFLSILILL